MAEPPSPPRRARVGGSGGLGAPGAGRTGCILRVFLFPKEFGAPYYAAHVGWGGMRLCLWKPPPLLRQRDNKYEITNKPPLIKTIIYHHQNHPTTTRMNLYYEDVSPTRSDGAVKTVPVPVREAFLWRTLAQQVRPFFPMSISYNI